LDTTEDKSLEEGKQPTEETEEVETAEETETEETAETTTGETQTAEGTEEETEETLEETKEEQAEEAEAEEQPEEGEEAAEEEKKRKKREEIPEEEIVEERTYTIPLSRAWIAPRKKRVPRAMRMVRAFIEKHMKIETGIKAEEEEEETNRLVISEEVNRKLWSHGIEKPPRNIRVRAVKDKEGTVTLYLAEGD
jgi:large subunit ribosomal protein L31e